MNVRLEVQKDKDDCGLACLAMISSRSYAEVKQKAVEIGFRKKGKYGFNTTDLKKLGEAFDVKLGYRCIPFKSLSLVPSVAILAINYKEDSGNWHWVVFKRENSEEFVLDPNYSLKKNKRTDFGRMNIGWWLKVST
jgi:ABC-type bacteriocin/lantibiotic exporter with double-glycine peptidase domain